MVEAHDEKEGYSRAPFLEPAIATALTGAACVWLAMSGVGEGLIKGMPRPAEAASSSTPYTEASRISFGVLDGRIQACPGSVNPNCVSTSSTNDMYSPAWRAPAQSAKASLLDLDATVLGSLPGSTKVIEADTPFGWYAAYAVPGRFGKPDVMEFLIKEEGVTNREWEGDKAGPLVLFRSLAGDVKYLWPITQPISDMDTQKKRLKQVRAELGWSLVGCELIECYDELEESNSLVKQFKLFGDGFIQE